MTVAGKGKPAAAGGEIGVLDLQGGVCEHLDHLRRLGIASRPVKGANDFDGLAGLILPGGESTCLARLLRIFSLDEAIVSHFHAGMKLWGTCAGAILLAERLTGEKAHLGLIDMEVRRNGFGSQLDSFACRAVIPRIAPEPLPLTFIRAPQIVAVGPGVEVLLRIGETIVAAESPDVLVTVFHPELTPCLAFHRYFAAKCGLTPRSEGEIIDASWTMTSWMGRAQAPQKR